MRFDGNFGGAPNYQPNPSGGPVDDASYREPPLRMSGDASRHDHRVHDDYQSQPGARYRLMSADQKTRLVNNLIAALKRVPRDIQIRQTGHFYKADPDYGRRVAKGLGQNWDDVSGKVPDESAHFSRHEE